jgi:hypothetical protein
VRALAGRQSLAHRVHAIGGNVAACTHCAPESTSDGASARRYRFTGSSPAGLEGVTCAIQHCRASTAAHRFNLAIDALERPRRRGRYGLNRSWHVRCQVWHGGQQGGRAKRSRRAKPALHGVNRFCALHRR